MTRGAPQRAGMRPALRQIEIDNGSDDRIKHTALGYHLTIAGLAVTQAEMVLRDSGARWAGWTLTHLPSGRSLGVYTEARDRAVAVAARLDESIKWARPYEKLQLELQGIQSAIRTAALAEGLVDVGRDYFEERPSKGDMWSSGRSLRT